MRGRTDKQRRKERRQEQPQRQPAPQRQRDDRAALDKLIAFLAGERLDAPQQQ